MHVTPLSRPFHLTSMDGSDNFVHQLAIKLSRVLNIVIPNDLLAQRVIEIAKNDPLDDFIKGILVGFRDWQLLTLLLQRQRLLASSRTLFLLNCMPIFCRMLSRRKPALTRSRCKGLQFMTVMFCNRSPRGLAVLRVRMWCVAEF